MSVQLRRTHCSFVASDFNVTIDQSWSMESQHRRNQGLTVAIGEVAQSNGAAQ
jgi:hypothetical protein